MRYDTVLFDLDGTLLDTLSDLAASVNASLSSFGFPTVEREHVRRSVGNGLSMLIRRCLPDGTDDATVIAVSEKQREIYGEHSMDLTVPYEGIPELLAELKKNGVRIAVLSNKADAFVAPIIERYFPGLCDLAVGEGNGIPRKPDPTGVYHVMKALGADPAKTVYVGDSAVDDATAKNAGLPAFVVSWGFRTEEELRSSGIVPAAGTVDELKALLI